MPASIAHMLIAHKTLQNLKKSPDKKLRDFAEMLDDSSADKCTKQYVNLGSLGPDLFYYLDQHRHTNSWSSLFMNGLPAFPTTARGSNGLAPDS